MSGTAIVKGEAGPVYRAPRAKTEACVWPPKYAKAVLTFADAETGEEVGEWAFCDARRLGRIKMADAEDPETVAPLSLLGADPLLDMPSIEVLATALAKRNAPIKAVLLDQNGVSVHLHHPDFDDVADSSPCSLFAESAVRSPTSPTSVHAAY